MGGVCAPFERWVVKCVFFSKNIHILEYTFRNHQQYTFPYPVPEGCTDTLRLTFIPQLLAEYIQYKYINGEKMSFEFRYWYWICSANNWGIYFNWGCLFALRALGCKMCFFLLKNIHILEYTFQIKYLS